MLIRLSESMTRSPIYAFILACIRVHALICETTEHLTLSFFTSLLPYTNRLKKKIWRVWNRRQTFWVSQPVGQPRASQRCAPAPQGLSRAVVINGPAIRSVADWGRNTLCLVRWRLERWCCHGVWFERKIVLRSWWWRSVPWVLEVPCTRRLGKHEHGRRPSVERST